MLNRRAIFFNTASQIVMRFVTLAFTLISVKLLTNYLGPRGIGEYNTITTYINFFIVLADLGLFAVTVREISKNPEKEKKIISNVFTIRLISALLACLVAILLVYFKYKTEPNIIYGTIIATGFLLFNLLGSVYDMVLQYRLKMQYSAIAEFMSKLFSILALVIIIGLGGGFLWITATIALSGILIFFFKFLFASRFIKFSPAYDRKLSAWIFNLAWPMGIVFILNGLFFKLDTLMLFVIKGATAVGIYSVAYKILEVSIFFGSYFASSLKPTFAREAHKKEYLGSIVSKALVVMLYLGLPIAIGSFVFAREIIVFLSNEDFASGSRALAFLAFTLPIMYFDILLSEILIAYDQRKLLVKIATFILSFNFLFNLIFIPRYSFMGAAWGTLISELILFFVNLHYTHKLVPYSIDFKIIYRLLLLGVTSLLFAFLLHTLPVHFLLGLAGLGLFYFVFSYLLNIVSAQSAKEILLKKGA